MRQMLYSVTVFIVLACIMALLGYIVDSVDIRWAILAGALGILGAGLTYNSYMFILSTDNRMEEINTTLSRIEELQREIQRKQMELAKSSSPIVNLSQALLQNYIDYLSKQTKQTNDSE